MIYDDEKVHSTSEVTDAMIQVQRETWILSCVPTGEKVAKRNERRWFNCPLWGP